MKALGVAKVLWLISLAVLASGIAVLFLYGVGEGFAHPGTSIVDAYLIGRLPWTPIGVGLVLGGATATLIFAAGVVLASDHWPVRGLAIAGLAAGALWWLYTLLLGGPVSECAPPCAGGRPRSDVITIAYSSPDLVIALLLIPAIVVSVLAYLVIRREGRPVGTPAEAPSP